MRDVKICFQNFADHFFWGEITEKSKMRDVKKMTIYGHKFNIPHTEKSKMRDVKFTEKLKMRDVKL